MVVEAAVRAAAGAVLRPAGAVLRERVALLRELGERRGIAEWRAKTGIAECLEELALASKVRVARGDVEDRRAPSWELRRALRRPVAGPWEGQFPGRPDSTGLNPEQQPLGRRVFI